VQKSWLLALKKNKIFKEDNGIRDFYSVWIMTERVAANKIGLE
jgi:hypothetical protein